MSLVKVFCYWERWRLWRAFSPGCDVRLTGKLLKLSEQDFDIKESIFTEINLKTMCRMEHEGEKAVRWYSSPSINKESRSK